VHVAQLRCSDRVVYIKGVRDHVDGPYNKDLTIKTSGLRGVYNKFHAHFGY
jgi:hypothetical protein